MWEGVKGGGGHFGIMEDDVSSIDDVKNALVADILDSVKSTAATAKEISAPSSGTSPESN